MAGDRDHGDRVIAIDLGADSGRVMRVSLGRAGFEVEEKRRFQNVPVRAGGTLYWDVLRLWHEIGQGIEAARSDGAASIGVDAWGVDYALLDRVGRLVGNPVHYRDERTVGAQEWVFERVPKRDVFARTGLQFLTLNTLYQLASMVREGDPQLDHAHSYLSFPDLIGYWLSGERVCEFTHASTTQFYNPALGTWDRDLLGRVGIPTRLFDGTPIVQPGTRIGAYQGIPVIAPATHDTGSAVVGIPTTSDLDGDFAYISSGTWSLIGLELPAPLITDESFAANVTNEGGVGGTWRFLKNVAGMWLAQQSRYTWRAAGRDYTYDQLAAMAQAAPAFTAFIDPDDVRFYAPGDIPSRIREVCAAGGQPVPADDGAVMRIIYESLALKSRHVLDRMIRLTGQRVTRLHIIGGGSNNALLNQMTANAFQRPVIAGPAEATAIGNAIVQFMALGVLGSMAEGRALLVQTMPTARYEPTETAAWDAAYLRFLDATGLGTEGAAS
jgi:rhamnulokinase